MFSTGTRVSVTNLFLKRHHHENAKILEQLTEIRNRNPRNLERLRIARKPAGYHLEAPTTEYWHKLEVIKGSRSITAEVIHFENGPVITASTKEWGIKKQLYKNTDNAAYVNLARVLAQRCLESAICEMSCFIKTQENTNLWCFLEEIKRNGILLEESERYKHPTPWHWERPEKPWETFE